MGVMNDITTYTRSILYEKHNIYIQHNTNNEPFLVKVNTYHENDGEYM